MSDNAPTGKRTALELRLENVSKRFGDVVALEPISLRVEPGLLVSLLGPSGCGKTTTLRIIAGLEVPDGGKVIIGGRDMSFLEPNKRGLGMVFQNYSLFPHMTVGENIAFGLKMAKISRQEITGRVTEMLDLVRLPGHEDRFPNQLSGGQQQRVALARSLVVNPSILLLDEPLGALDKNLRESMQFELRRIQQTLGITTILVTHDQEEALTLSDQVVVMNNGRILQVGSPSVVYEYPESRFVSEFLGNSNLFEGDIFQAEAGGRRSLVVEYADTKTVLTVADTKHDAVSGPAILAVRPEKMTLAQSKPVHGNAIEASVLGYVFRGSYHAFEMRVTGRTEPLFVYDQARSRTAEHIFQPGESVFVCWNENDSVLLLDD